MEKLAYIPRPAASVKTTDLPWCRQPTYKKKNLPDTRPLALTPLDLPPLQKEIPTLFARPPYP